MRKSKQIVLMLTAAFLMTVTTAKAQIFILEDDMDNARVDEVEWTLVVPAQGLDTDQFAPLNGVWMLGGLGLAYFLSKRKKNDDN